MTTKRILRIVYLSTAIGSVLGIILAAATSDTSEILAWISALAMAGAGFIKETDEE